MTKTVDQVKKSLQNLLQREIDRLRHYAAWNTFGQIANEEYTAINQRILTISVVLEELSIPDYSVKRVEENLTVLLKQAVEKLNSITQIDTLSRVQYYEANQLVLLLDAIRDDVREIY